MAAKTVVLRAGPRAHPAAAPTGTDAVAIGSRLYFHNRRRFWFKTALLAAATIALIPILLLQHELAALIYVAFLVVVHVVGLFIFAMGVKRHDIAPTVRGFVTRIVGILVAVGLLYLVAKLLRTSSEAANPAVSWVFWTSLFLIWFLHTAGLLLLHLRGQGEAKACPFV